MYRILFFICIISMTFLSCEKEGVLQSEIDEEIILEYIAANNLTAVKHSSGLYYIIENEGEGDNPILGSDVTINYSGYLTNGTVFDSGTIDSYPLYNLIEGWQIGIPLLKPGGKAKLIMPSRLAYGPYRSGIIPPNSVLIFDVELVDFQ